MRFAREGYSLIASAFLLAMLAVLGALDRGSLALWIVALLLSVLAVWVAIFFRDPERVGPRGDRLVIAPADGVVLPTSETDEPTFLGDRALRVSIFMNVLDVHVNRYPVSGIVRYVHYNPGRFLHAASHKASLANEQRSVGIDTGSRRVLVRQIAGLVARRIVTYARAEDRVEQGARMGLIRFGSRVDVFLPTDTSIRVREGDRTRAGVTIIAEFAQ